jgi:hypothetical protein
MGCGGKEGEVMNSPAAEISQEEAKTKVVDEATKPKPKKESKEARQRRESQERLKAREQAKDVDSDGWVRGSSGMRTPPPDLRHIFYDSGVYWLPDGKGQWTRTCERTAVRHLKIEHSVENRQDVATGISDMDRELEIIRKECWVDYVGSLAGHKAGLVKMNGKRILVNSSPNLIEPREGDFSVIAALLDGRLGKQRIYVEYWLKFAFQSLMSGNHRPGHVLVLAGPKDCGKSLLQNQIFTPVLGGRTAKPALSMRGETPFNADLFEAEHLMIEDDLPSSDIRARRAYGTFMKQLAANEKVHHHAKGKQPMVLEPLWRLSVSTNEEPENLMILPPIDDSVSDKILILKVERNPLPMPAQTDEERKAFIDRIKSELPAFVHHLINLKVAEEHQALSTEGGRRYGFKGYQNPEILEAINGLSPEHQLLELIDEAFSGKEESWTAKASWIETVIRLEFRDQAAKLFYHSRVCATLLDRLATKEKERVSWGWGHGKVKIFTIRNFPPKIVESIPRVTSKGQANYQTSSDVLKDLVLPS